MNANVVMIGHVDQDNWTLIGGLSYDSESNMGGRKY